MTSAESFDTGVECRLYTFTLKDRGQMFVGVGEFLSSVKGVFYHADYQCWV